MELAFAELQSVVVFAEPHIVAGEHYVVLCGVLQILVTSDYVLPFADIAAPCGSSEVPDSCVDLSPYDPCYYVLVSEAHYSPFGVCYLYSPRVALFQHVAELPVAPLSFHCPICFDMVAEA